jgi:hypothetical protein
MSPRESRFTGLGVKFLALLLAWGLWYAVREDLDETREFELPVVVRPAPGSNVDGEPLRPRAAGRIKGPRRELDLLLPSGRPLAIVTRPEDLTVDQHSGTHEYTASDLVLPDTIRAGTVRILDIEPEVFPVRLWRVERREVPLAPPEFPGAEETGVQVERKRWPQKAVVRAPLDQLGGLLVLRTAVDRDRLRQLVEAMGDAPRTTVTLPLSIIETPTDRLSVVEPRALEVTADLVRNAEVEVTVDLEVFRDVEGSAPRLRVVADAARPWIAAGDRPKITLTLRGTPRALAAVSPKSFRAFLVASELPSGAERGELRLHTSDLPSGVVLAKESVTVAVEAAR